MDIILRKEAKAQELKRYFTGKPCKRGHVAERSVINCMCIECRREHKKRYSIDNQDYIKIQSKLRYLTNKKYILEQNKQWRDNNKSKKNELSAKRRAFKKQALPVWHEQEKDLINQLYNRSRKLSKLWNIQLTVDHIVPLNNKYVCGLHCWANLQLLDGVLNSSKSNKYEGNQ